MRVVNPIGRKAESSLAAHNLARACMCGTWANFSATQTTDDSCDHCGCNCYNEDGDTTKYKSNNFNSASGANRATPVS